MPLTITTQLIKQVMNNQQQIYNDLNNKYKEKYTTFMGINADSTEVKRFTVAEQVERFAKNICFWKIEMDALNKQSLQPSKKVPDKDRIAAQIVQQGIEHIQQIIHDKFDEPIRHSIHDRANTHMIMYNNDKNYLENIEATRQKMATNAQTATNLFQQALQEEIQDPTGHKLLDPPEWIGNQTAMRTAWEKHETELKTKGECISIFLTNNKFTEYMRFMYSAYPEKFGDTLKQQSQEQCILADGAEIYYMLQNNIDISNISNREHETSKVMSHDKDMKTKSKNKSRKKKKSKNKQKANKEQNIVGELTRKCVDAKYHGNCLPLNIILSELFNKHGIQNSVKNGFKLISDPEGHNVACWHCWTETTNNKYDIAADITKQLYKSVKEQLEKCKEKLSETLPEKFERFDNDNKPERDALRLNEKMWERYKENPQTFWETPTEKGQQQDWRKAVTFRNSMINQI